MAEQSNLALIAAKTAFERDIPVLISNHDTVDTRRLYALAQLSELQVSRFISHKGNGRKKVSELLALYIKPTSR